MAGKDIYSYSDNDEPAALSRMLIADAMTSTAWGPVIVADAATGQLQLGGFEQGDTGWRDISGDLLNSWATTGTFQIRRVGNLVELGGLMDSTAATADSMYLLLAGFRSSSQSAVGSAIKAGSTFVGCYVNGSTDLRLDESEANNSTRFTISFTTTDAWPASLPGS